MWGSVLGASEYVAEALAEKLQTMGHQTVLHLEPDFESIAKNDIWLVCSSTHGAGDLPDNIQTFADAVAENTLTALPYCVVSLGDSSYDTFLPRWRATLPITQKSAGKTASRTVRN